MFMKLLQTLIVLLCFCLKVEAQMMGSNHVMRGGDKVEWKQVSYKEFQSAGLGCVWNLSDMETLDKKTDVEYFVDPKNANDTNGYLTNREFLLYIFYDLCLKFVD